MAAARRGSQRVRSPIPPASRAVTRAGRSQMPVVSHDFVERLHTRELPTIDIAGRVGCSQRRVQQILVELGYSQQNGPPAPSPALMKWIVSHEMKRHGPNYGYKLLRGALRAYWPHLSFPRRAVMAVMREVEPRAYVARRCVPLHLPPRCQRALPCSQKNEARGARLTRCVGRLQRVHQAKDAAAPLPRGPLHVQHAHGPRLQAAGVRPVHRRANTTHPTSPQRKKVGSENFPAFRKRSTEFPKM